LVKGPLARPQLENDDGIARFGNGKIRDDENKSFF
jgi:hypothetical protein